MLVAVEAGAREGSGNEEGERRQAVWCGAARVEQNEGKGRKDVVVSFYNFFLSFAFLFHE